MHDSTKDYDYWERTPHVPRFINHPPRDGESCRLCLRKVDACEAHIEAPEYEPGIADPNHFIFEPRMGDNYPVPPAGEIIWAIEGWNDTGGSCSYGRSAETLEAAQARAAQYQESGDERGVRYDHYAVVERVYHTVASIYVHPVPTREGKG